MTRMVNKVAGRGLIVDPLVAGERWEECPSCKHVLLVRRPDGFEVPGRKTWLSDGDVLPGVLSQLRPDQKKPDAHYFSLLVGDCPKCRSMYYVVCASLLDADMSDRTEGGLEPDDFLSFNVPMDLKEIDVCFLEDLWDETRGEWTLNPLSSWILEVYRTPFGLMHHHEFGPFPLDSPEDVVHPEFGVMACQGSGSDPWRHGESLVLALFDKLRTLVGESNGGNGRMKLRSPSHRNL